MPRSTSRVAIVGGGIAGLSLAYALASRVPVTVVEAGAIGSRGASSVPAALLNPHRGRTARAHPDDVAGLAAFWRRDAELRGCGHDTGSHRTGVLRIASTERQAKLWKTPAADDDGVRHLESHEVPQPYHAPHGAIEVRDGGWVQPDRLLAALSSAARDAGALVVENAPVTDMAPAGAGWCLSAAGARWRATHVVVCTGAEPVPGPHRPAVAVERVAGDVVGLAPAPRFARPVAGAVYGAWAADTAWVGGNHREPDASDPTAAQTLRNSFAWFVPGLRDAPVISTWTGVRVKRKGNRPWSGEIADGVWFFGAMAGRGFLCSAAEAETLAQRILARSGPGGASQGRASK